MNYPIIITVLKPSERVPGVCSLLVELAHRAGVPAGVLSIVHGGKDTVNALCDDPRIKAISFVGSDAAGKHIWDRAGNAGKRVQVSGEMETCGKRPRKRKGEEREEG